MKKTLNKTCRMSAALLLLVSSTHIAAKNSALAQPSFHDPLKIASIIQKNPSQQPLMSVIAIGNQLIAVGMRGLIIRSNDQSRAWHQVISPVQSDLLAAHFVSPTHGWVVGHNGTILHTQNGGKSWVKQLDGLKAAKTLPAYYAKRIQSGEAELAEYKHKVAMNFAGDAALPVLDVWFRDAKTGFAVGAFGTLLRSNDGGQNWHPALHEIDNPDMLHLNSITQVNNQLFITSERGRVFRYDETSSRFNMLQTGYEGGLFGIEGGNNSLLVYGLGGKAFISHDNGNSWQAVLNESIASLTGSTFDQANNQFILVSSAGDVLTLPQTGSRLKAIYKASSLLADIDATTTGELVAVGLTGVTHLPCTSDSCR